MVTEGMGQQPTREEQKACCAAMAVWVGLERICRETIGRLSSFLSSQSLDVGMKEMGSEQPRLGLLALSVCSHVTQDTSLSWLY